MSHARDTTLTLFVTYLSPLKPKACAAKIEFFFSLMQVVSFLGLKIHFFFTYAGCNFSG